MKKGFTLVELAVVLVIIGLIMGMVIKGREIIDVAKMTREISKFRKAEYALATYYSTYGRLPPRVIVTNANHININELAKFGITAGDVVSGLTNGTYKFSEIEIWDKNVNWVVVPYNSPGRIYSDMSTVKTQMVAMSPTSNVNGWTVATSMKLYGHMEKILDDNDPYLGDVRYIDRERTVLAADFFTDTHKYNGNLFVGTIVFGR